MAISNYAVLVGTPVAGRIFPPRSPRNQPHFHIHVRTANGGNFDIAVNVQSGDGSEVLYFVNDKFLPPNAAALEALPEGFTYAKDDAESGVAIDFVRMKGLVSRDQMTLLPLGQTVPGSALHSSIELLLTRAIAQNATVFAFGQKFRNGKNSKSPFWHFAPDQGIHDIHMNQGNPPGPHEKDNGTYQDGALFLKFPDGTWSAVFIAFQSQSFNTDEEGNQASPAVTAA